MARLRGHGAPIDLLLTDVIMPGRNGRELARDAQEFQPGLPVLFMSGYADRTFGPEGPGGLGDAFLQKPFALDVLVARVRQVIGATPRQEGEGEPVESAPPQDGPPASSRSRLWPADEDAYDRRMSVRNSVRVRASSRNVPSIALVTADDCCFSTPRIAMQRWVPSMTTATPSGSTAS